LKLELFCNITLPDYVTFLALFACIARMTGCVGNTM
jgi:hypothetical protein